MKQKRIWMRDFSFLRTWKSSLKAMLRSRSYKWETFILTPPNSNKACFAEHGTPVCRPITCCTVTSGLYQSHTTPTFLEMNVYQKPHRDPKFCLRYFLLIAEIHLFCLSSKSFHISSPWLVFEGTFSTVIPLSPQLLVPLSEITHKNLFFPLHQRNSSNWRGPRF